MEANVIATNYHVVENAAVISARLVMQKRNLRITGIIGFDADKDLALLSVEGIRIRPLPLAKSGKLSIFALTPAPQNPTTDLETLTRRCRDMAKQSFTMEAR